MQYLEQKSLCRICCMFVYGMMLLQNLHFLKTIWIGELWIEHLYLLLFFSSVMFLISTLHPQKNSSLVIVCFEFACCFNCFFGFDKVACVMVKQPSGKFGFVLVSIYQRGLDIRLFELSSKQFRSHLFESWRIDLIESY